MRSIADSGKRMTDDLYTSRRRLVLSLQQCKELETVVDQFQKAVDTADHEARKLQRTLRLLETNSGLKGALAPKQREVEELRASYGAKIDEYQQLTDILASRSRKLRLANRMAQALKVTVARKEESARTLIDALDRLARQLRQKRGGQRLEKTKAEREANDRRNVIKQQRARLRKVDVELGRVRCHKGDFVNSDMWNPGVLQRIATNDLRLALITEQRALEDQVRALERNLKKFERTMRAANRELRVTDNEAQTVEDVGKAVSDAYKEATGRSIAEELEHMEAEQQRAEALAAEAFILG